MIVNSGTPTKAKKTIAKIEGDLDMIKIVLGAPNVNLTKDQRILYENAVKSGEEYLRVLKQQLQSLKEANADNKEKEPKKE